MKSNNKPSSPDDPDTHSPSSIANSTPNSGFKDSIVKEEGIQETEEEEEETNGKLLSHSENSCCSSSVTTVTPSRSNLTNRLLQNQNSPHTITMTTTTSSNSNEPLSTSKGNIKNKFIIYINNYIYKQNKIK